MQASLSKYRGPIENCEQTPLGKSFCLGRELCEIAVTLQRAGITRVEPLEGNGWMVLVLLLWAPACKTRKASEDIFDRVFGERIGAACGWSTEYEYAVRVRLLRQIGIGVNCSECTKRRPYSEATRKHQQEPVLSTRREFLFTSLHFTSFTFHFSSGERRV